jgi:hypothetical protein
MCGKSSASDPMRASLGGRIPEGGKSGTLDRQRNLLREMGGPWQGSARKLGNRHVTSERGLRFRHSWGAMMSAKLNLD